MTRDAMTARQLFKEKREFHELEREANDSHLNRLRQGLVESIETPGLHIDILRDLKHIDSHITAIGYAALSTARTPTAPSRMSVCDIRRSSSWRISAHLAV